MLLTPNLPLLEDGPARESNIPPTVTIDAPTIPIGGEALVNTTTAGAQQDAKIAALDDGGYVVLWSSSAADFSDVGIVGQRYAVDGTPIGGEFTVDTLGTFDFTRLSVTALDGGGFVVSWQDVDPIDGRFVAAQMFDANGDPVGGPVQVTPPGTGGFPVVAGLSGGGFVVTWLAADGDGIGVHAQLFDANGDTVGSDFIVNGTITGTQTVQAAASLADGGFVVTWTSFNTDSNFTEVFAQRFDAAGNPVDGEFLVPRTSPTGDQSDAVVTGLANGGFVISWTQAPTFSNVNVHAQLYDASGNPVGNEFTVDTPSALRQGTSTVTALADGGFLISWKSGDSSGFGEILAQRYDANGTAVGGEVHVTDGSHERYAPVAAGLADGGFAIAWTSMNQDGSSAGIYAQVYDPALAAIEQVPLDLKGHITIADADAGSDIISVTLSVTEGVLAVAAGTSGVTVDDSDSQHIVLSGTLAEIQALLGSDPTSSVSYTYDDDFLPLAAIGLDVTIDDGTDSATDTVLIDLTPVNDAAELDLDFFSPGNDAVATYVAGDPGTPIAFNATFDDDNANWDGATLTIAITGAAAGDQLAIDDTLTSDLTISGSDILYQGDVVGSFSGGANGAALVVTFNAEACACAIEEVTYAITYANNGAVTGLSTRDVTFTFVDGGGTANGGVDTATATVALTVTPPPTPPVVDAGAAAAGSEDSPITLTGITITDAGDPASGLVTVHLGVEHGTLTIRTDVPGGIDASEIVTSATGHGITIIATPDQINATIAANGLTYLGDTNFNGDDALTITANDGTPDTPLALSSLGAIPFSDYPSAVAFYDLDNDGIDDLILGVGDGSAPGAVLVLASGIGAFPLPGGAADAFAFGDFDGDGIVDIGIASYAADGSGYVGYFSSVTGDVVTIANVPYALDLAAGDFNGDGLMDLAVANSDSGNIAILIQTAPGAFAPPVYTATTGLLTVSIRTGDFNGDGVIDLLASNYGTAAGFAPPGSIDLFLGNGDGSFAAATQVWTGMENADGLVVGDFNGDGVDDFAFATTEMPGGQNGVMVALGNGDGTFGAATPYVTTASGTPGRVVAGDLNDDGILDLAVTNLDAPGTVSILLGNGDGSFQAPFDLHTGDGPNVLALGDADGDGDLDLIVGSAADGTYEAFNNDDFHRGGGGVKPIAVAGSAVAKADAISTAENAISAGSLFLDHGAGADSDSDGDALVIAAVNGSAADVGSTITLASGAKLTVNADGSYSYDPNGKFVTLTDASSGAVNTSATDSFTYTLAGGNTATVTITLNGVAGAGDRLAGDGGDNVIHGTSGGDFFIDTTGGNEDWTGLGGNDVFLFGATLTSADKVDGGAGLDQIAIQGDYSTLLTLGTGLIGLESFAILPGSDTRFGDTGTNLYDYNIATVDQNVAAGVMLVVDANRLSLGEDFTFDGSAETDGKFFIYGGGGTDTLTGGAQNDAFYFGENSQFGATDTVHGGAGTDQLGLRGDYTIVFGANQLVSIENIGLVSALDTRFGPLGVTYDYDLTMNDGNVLAGQQMTVDAAALRAGETLTFNGSAETNGSFRVFGGAGNDVITGSDGDDILTGWAGADSLTGGLGHDIFRYNLASDSAAAAHDTIQDFTLGDIIDLSRIDANPGQNGDQGFSLIGNAAFGHHVGELRYENAGVNNWTVQGDIDGDGVADFQISVVVADGHGFTPGDFFL
jgi:VCBS repeat-containing protein